MLTAGTTREETEVDSEVEEAEVSLIEILDWFHEWRINIVFFFQIQTLFKQ